MARRVIEPPTLDPVLNENAHSHSWTDYHNKSADLLNDLVERVTNPRGITDGSDAPAGVVGEELTASGSAPLSTGVAANVATLTLPAGDWEVTGWVNFTAAGANTGRFATGVDTFGMEFPANLPAGSGTWRMSAGAPVRRNVTADTAVHLVAACAFTSGSVTADGSVRARRVR